MIEIPLSSDPEQKFSISLNGVTYKFRVLYNTRTESWSMDISTGTTELVNGVGLLIGGDLMASYNFDLKNLFVVNVSGKTVDANATNLGTEVKLYQLTDAESANVPTI